MGLLCPHCAFRFNILVMNTPCEVPPAMPVVCQQCLKLSMFENGGMRAITMPEEHAIKNTQSYKDLVERMRIILHRSRMAANARNN